MQRVESYPQFVDRIFEELDAKQQSLTRTTVDFIRFAASKNFSIDDLIQMTKAGMSGKRVWNTVASKCQHEQPTGSQK